MILPDHGLHELCHDGLVSPYTPAHVNPASIDLTLSNEFVDLRTSKHFTANKLILRPPTILDAIVVRGAGARWDWLRRRADRWLREQPRTAVLASTIERITMPLDCAGVLYLKSSLARAGLDHALAGFVDCGFCGTLTLEVHAHRKITLVTGQQLVQLVLYRMEGRPDVPYQGRYQGQEGPTEAREIK